MHRANNNNFKKNQPQLSLLLICCLSFPTDELLPFCRLKLLGFKREELAKEALGGCGTALRQSRSLRCNPAVYSTTKQGQLCQPVVMSSTRFLQSSLNKRRVRPYISPPKPDGPINGKDRSQLEPEPGSIQYLEIPASFFIFSDFIPIDLQVLSRFLLFGLETQAPPSPKKKKNLVYKLPFYSKLLNNPSCFSPFRSFYPFITVHTCSTTPTMTNVKPQSECAEQADRW